jgi:hypothetical protein
MNSSALGGTCWNCGKPLTPFDYGRGDTCQSCGRDTRVCKGCEFYDPSLNNECKENQADRVVDKEKANFCDYFKPASRAGQNPDVSRNNLRLAAESLFNKKK